MARTHPRKATTAGAARRDREFAQRQALELDRMLRAQRRVRVLARRLKHAVRLADAARFDAAITLVNETDYSVVSREALNGLAERAVSAEMRAVKLEEQFAALERDRGGEVR